MSDILADEKNEKEWREVVRIRRSWWSDRRGIYERISITWMRKKSVGYTPLSEDTLMIGCDEVIPKITNLANCKDGLYEVSICNESIDWETGYVDDYKYKLTPYAQ